MITTDLVTPKEVELLYNKPALGPNGRFVEHQGIIKGEVSLYCWPPVRLVWNQLFDHWQFFIYLKNRLIQTSQTGGQQYSDTSPSVFPIEKPCKVSETQQCETQSKGSWSHLNLQLISLLQQTNSWYVENLSQVKGAHQCVTKFTSTNFNFKLQL